MWTKLTTNKAYSALIFVISLGLLSGIASTMFLKALYFVTDQRKENLWLLYLLPLFALCQYLLTKKLSNFDISFKQVLERQSLNNTATKSLLLAPYIFITSIGTHLFGGSAGREGVGVLMATGLANFHQKLKLDQKEILYCGISAGFSSIFGTPLAAIVFSYELNRFEKVKSLKLLMLTSTTSIISYYVTVFMGLSHNYAHVDFSFSINVFFLVFLCGIACSFGAHALITCQFFIKKFFCRPMLVFLVALILILIAKSFKFEEYLGIGVTFIEESFVKQRSFLDFSIKLVFTSITLGIGLKGGEVTPLFFMGATLANTINGIFNLGLLKASTALGMFTFFAAATLTPITSTIMAYEYYGIKVALITLPASLLASMFMKNRSVYK